MDQGDRARVAAKSKQSLIDHIVAECGLEAFLDEVADLVLPTICFEATEMAPGAAPLSRLGGLPDLPLGMEWPHRDPLPDLEGFMRELTRGGDEDVFEAWGARWPLTFIADIDLASAHALYPAQWPLPETGRLLLFWDPLCGAWNSKYTCQVIWDQTPPSERRRAEAPWAAASPAYIRFVYKEVEGSFIRKTEDLDGSDALMPAFGLNPVIRWVIPEAEMRLRKFGRGSWQESGALYDCLTHMWTMRRSTLISLAISF